MFENIRAALSRFEANEARIDAIDNEISNASDVEESAKLYKEQRELEVEDADFEVSLATAIRRDLRYPTHVANLILTMEERKK